VTKKASVYVDYLIYRNAINLSFYDLDYKNHLRVLKLK